MVEAVTPVSLAPPWQFGRIGAPTVDGPVVGTPPGPTGPVPAPVACAVGTTPLPLPSPWPCAVDSGTTREPHAASSAPRTATNVTVRVCRCNAAPDYVFNDTGRGPASPSRRVPAPMPRPSCLHLR